ncbi:hypothetical protein HRbin40_00074 [bacterium HR40]|nr:hypothetical protein HRbin40_00074 [bacterium HR40]
MTNPQRFLNRLIVFLIVALAVVAALYATIWRAFLYNPALNGLILGVLLVGLVHGFRRILMLKREIAWLEEVRQGRGPVPGEEPPRLLGPVAHALATRGPRAGVEFGTLGVRHMLDSLSSRLDESRDIARYQTGLLIFLGLLGTFWGLIETIQAIAGVIAGLEVTSSELADVFAELKAGLTAPLSGMGTSFSSSLFGLAGSLVLGFADLQATQAQNAFYNDVEEWLTGLARDEGPTASPEGRRRLAASEPVPAYVQALLEQTAENLDRLQRNLERDDAAREQLATHIGHIARALAGLDDRMRRDQEVLTRLAEAQHSLAQQLAERSRAAVPAVDEATRNHLRSLDVQLQRLLEETVRGREEMTRELRNELRIIARTIAVAAGEPQLMAE